MATHLTNADIAVLKVLEQAGGMGVMIETLVARTGYAVSTMHASTRKLRRLGILVADRPFEDDTIVYSVAR